MTSRSPDEHELVRDIAIVDGSTSVTGGLRAAVRISSLLAPQTRTHLVIPRGGDIPAASLSSFASVTTIPDATVRKSGRALATFVPASIVGGFALRRLLRQTNAHTLILNDFPQLYGWLARRLGYCGTILTFVRFAPDRFPAWLAKLWLAAAAQSTDRVIAVSKYIQRQLPRAIDSYMLYDCIDPALELGVNAVRPMRIICIANYIRGKGQDDTLRAFAKVAPRFPEAKLAFYGGDMGLKKNAAYRLELEDARDKLGLADRVEMNAFVADVSGPLAHAMVAINLSISESFSFTCLEAGQLGVPVIAYRSGGPEEIIVEGETGFLCPIGDIDLVAIRMAQIFADPARAAKMGSEARKSVLSRFSQAKFVADLKSVMAR